MATPLETPKIYHCVNSITTIEDLDDDMLTQILLRLPNCETVLVCSPVNKRWCSLISDPKFPVLFDNHKKKTTTLLKLSGSDLEDDDEPLWTIVTTDARFGSPKLSLEFLPYNSFIATATFKDLVLCYSETRKDTWFATDRYYYITNPLTKQWVELPRPDQKRATTNRVLIRQPSYNHTGHYKFRVVEVSIPCWNPYDKSENTIYLVVYCSEISEWKNIELRIPMEAVGRLVEVSTAEPDVVVCNGIIYFKSGLCLVALDPFDVNGTCDMTLDVTVMPPLPDCGYLKESSGQLLVVHTPGRQRFPFLGYTKEGTTIKLQMEVWKLDLNQTPLVWEPIYQGGLCEGITNSIEDYTGFQDIYPLNIMVHPYNDKLLYIYLATEKQVFMCDTRTSFITSLKSLSDDWRVLLRLEHQWWPTSVPALV